MIETLDTEVVNWLTAAVAPAPVTLGPPAPADGELGVTCHLLGLRPEAPTRGMRRTPVEAIARYLVTVSAPAPLDAHRLLGLVLVAAADRPDIDLEPDEPALALWSALGTPPRPGLIVRARVRWPRDERRAPLVREPVRVRFQDIGALAGIVVSPTGTPVARAEVRLPGVETPVWTGPDGTFVAAGAPVSADRFDVTVTARGLSRVVSVPAPSEPPPDSSAPLTIVFDPEE